jgi:hypothetical protein
MKHHEQLVAFVLSIAACASTPQRPAAAASATIELAWDLHPTASENHPTTRVALVANGQSKLVAGDIFGHCSRVDESSWGGPEKPLSVIMCGWAGNFRDVAAIRAGDTVIVKVRELEENGPDGKTETVGGAVTIPSGTMITLAAEPIIHAATPFEPVATCAAGDVDAEQQIEAALAAHQIELDSTYSKGVTLAVPADRAAEARKIIQDLIDHDHVAATVAR